MHMQSPQIAIGQSRSDVITKQLPLPCHSLRLQAFVDTSALHSAPQQAAVRCSTQIADDTCSRWRDHAEHMFACRKPEFWSRGKHMVRTTQHRLRATTASSLVPGTLCWTTRASSGNSKRLCMSARGSSPGAGNLLTHLCSSGDDSWSCLSCHQLMHGKKSRNWGLISICWNFELEITELL